jgi:hypothetical protein
MQELLGISAEDEENMEYSFRDQEKEEVLLILEETDEMEHQTVLKEVVDIDIDGNSELKEKRLLIQKR